MELLITGKNMDISPEIHGYIERKLGKLGRYLPEAAEARVEISQEETKSPQQHYVAQVIIDGSGTILRGEERAADLYTAVNRVVAVTNRQIEHAKGKRNDRRKGGPSNRVKSVASVEPAQLPAEVVKVKRFTVEPMPVEEAIYQMEILGHEFFLFINDVTGRLNLIYHRKDGNYGLIDPQGI